MKKAEKSSKTALGSAENPNARLETFCDGVFAIALTLLILEFKLPQAETIHSTLDLWQYLGRLMPSTYAFLLSYLIIAVSWLNHHEFMRLVGKSDPLFINANILLLVSIAILPFTAALLAEFGFTDHASPAVVLYSLGNLLTNLGWIALTHTALRGAGLAKNEENREAIAQVGARSRQGFILYGVCTIASFWFPVTVSIIITLSWIAWLVLGMTIRPKEA
ncbi:MAG: TMEM175 family protein [candidate division FCPU426 bacterium]